MDSPYFANKDIVASFNNSTQSLTLPCIFDGLKELTHDSVYCTMNSCTRN